MTLRSAPATVIALTLLLAARAQAQQAPTGDPQSVQFTDPANLRGERVKPRDGRELPIDQGARGLEQLLRKLNTRASLMLIVAHPDDEDGGMLTYYSRGLGARVAMLTLTRGEGGQNAMTGDFEDALGLLRTQELLSADRYLGVDQFFGTEVDFGFSKTKEEAFKKWTHERVLYDAVRSIRLFRPLVIAAVFIGGVTDGHGQHQVSGQIAQEAFKAAADPTVFPDMIAEGILPWQALKVYARVPMQSISDKGLFDYATGKYTAPRFENYVTGEVTTTVPSSDVIVHEGTTDPILSDVPSAPPRSYVQFARIGLGMQKSQVGGRERVPPAGAFDVAYHLYGSALCSSPTHIKDCHPERSAQRGVEGSASRPAAPNKPAASENNPESASFFDGIDTSIEGMLNLAPHLPMSMKAGLHDLNSSISRASLVFQGTHSPNSQDNELGRQLVAVSLADPLKHIDGLIAGIEATTLPQDEKENVLHELRIKRVQLNDALLLALGLELDAIFPTDETVANQKVDVRVHLTSRSTELLSKPKLFLLNSAGAGLGDGASFDSQSQPLDAGHPIDRDLGLTASMTSNLSRPYFHRENIEQPFYDLNLPMLRNAPSTPNAVVAGSTLQYMGVPITLERIAHGPTQPISIVPPVSLTLSSNAEVLIRYREPVFFITATVKGNPVPPGSRVKLTGPKGWPISQLSATSPSETEFKIVEPSVEHPLKATFSASVTVPKMGTYSDGYRAVGYPGLVSTNYFTPATDRVVPIDLKVPLRYPKIAYLPGTGDAVPEALASINLKPEILTVADLTPAKLAQYDTVILGVRTYAAHPDLHGAPTQALLDYARNGGNVLVQYQTAEFTAADAPYPLTLGYAAEKVVDETDPVQLLDAKAPFLNTPNKITPADFDNWVEERGHGFLGTWDSHYTALTETHDPDQDPQRGGLITTPLGKGRWTYCAFALYRQLPEAVPGAFRIFVNLITPVK
jgi:LmbE family N-acetylglucosaminyl deacetylase